MTVRQLIFALIRGILRGDFRPGDLVTREHGEWDQDGRDNVKAIYFASRRLLREHPDPQAEMTAGLGGLHHRRFGHYGTGEARNVVVLD